MKRKLYILIAITACLLIAGLTIPISAQSNDIEAGIPMNEDIALWQSNDLITIADSGIWYCNANLPVNGAGTLMEWQLYIDQGGTSGETAQLAVIRPTAGGGEGPVLSGCILVGLGPPNSIIGNGVNTLTLADSTQLDGATPDPRGIVVQAGDYILAKSGPYNIGIDCNGSSLPGGCPGPDFNIQYITDLETVAEPFTLLDSSLDGTLMIRAWGYLNRTPIAENDFYEMNDVDEYLVIPAPGVLSNDYDHDAGDNLTAEIDSQPSNGVVTMSTDGSFQYTPFAGFRGIDSFVYSVSDGWGGTSTAIVTINVISTEFEQIMSRFDEVEADINDILAQVDEMSGGIDYLKEVVSKIDIEFITQLPHPDFTIFHFGISIGGVPIEPVQILSAHAIRFESGVGQLSDNIGAYVNVNSAMIGHMRVVVTLPSEWPYEASDYWMYEFNISYEDGGNTYYGTCIVMNENYRTKDLGK